MCMTRGATQYLYISHAGDEDGMDDAAIYKTTLDGKVVGKFGSAGKQLEGIRPRELDRLPQRERPADRRDDELARAEGVAEITKTRRTKNEHGRHAAERLAFGFVIRDPSICYVLRVRVLIAAKNKSAILPIARFGRMQAVAANQRRRLRPASRYTDRRRSTPSCVDMICSVLL